MFICDYYQAERGTFLQSIIFFAKTMYVKMEYFMCTDYVTKTAKYAHAIYSKRWNIVSLFSIIIFK